ncbi:MAG TPA: hypothetical protein VNM36_09330 [Gemmatimonadaceae bacterium]|nr:hypothetical protein [Gemmatimonadaceae bacterium]
MTAMQEDEEELFVTTTDIDGRTYSVSVRVDFDGIEHVGHLLFRDSDWEEDEGLRDHGTIPGRSRDDIQAAARALSNHDLTLRHRRAITDRRRFNGLRHLTQEVLAQIRYLNKVATSMRAGLLDVEEAANEIAGTEQRLHDMVGQLRNYAGVAT